MNFFNDVIAKLITAEFEGHTTFSVADNTAIGNDPIRILHLDAVPAGESVIISLSWEGGDKIFEKTLTPTEAQHQFDLISTDLAEAVALTQKGEYDAAKQVMKSLVQKYTENTGEIVDTNMPAINHNQASQDDHLWKEAKITMQNLFFTSNDELMDYQKKMKELNGGNSADRIPLWDKNKGQDKEENPGDEELAPGNVSYEDAEKQKQKETKNLDKQIKDQVKTEVESALIDKAATVFGPDQVELVDALKKNGRNWDEIKKILTKDFNFDKDATTIFVDEQRQKAEGTPPDADKPKEEADPLRPPKSLVPDEVHDSLVKEVEDKKPEPKPEEEKGLSPKDIMDIPEEPAIKEESALETCQACGGVKPAKCACGSIDGIARADNSDIRRVANLKVTARGPFFEDFNPERQQQIIDTVSSNIAQEEGLTGDALFEAVDNWININNDADSLMEILNQDLPTRTASKKTALNPLQVPPAPAAGATPSPKVPAQDEVPMGVTPSDHPAPKPGDRVYVSSELGDEKPGYEGKFISEYSVEGTKWSIVEREDGKQENVESHRLSTVAPTEKGPEPTFEPKVETPSEEPEISVEPKLSELHSSLDEIKAEMKTIEAQLDKEADPVDAPAVEAPKPPATTLKDVKITPDKIDKEKAVPATPELSQAIEELQRLEANLKTLETAREEVATQLKAKQKEIDEVGGRAELESQYKNQIEKTGVLIEAIGSQLVKYNGMFLSFQQQEKTVEVKPNYKDLMERAYKKFPLLEKFITDVMNGMQSLAKSVTTRTLTRWPEKRSDLNTEASIGEELEQMNQQLLEALKLLSEPVA